MIKISSKNDFIMKLVLCILGLTVGGGVHLFPSYISEVWAANIVQTAAYLLFFLTGLYLFLTKGEEPPIVSTTITK